MCLVFVVGIVYENNTGFSGFAARRYRNSTCLAFLVANKMCFALDERVIAPQKREFSYMRCFLTRTSRF